MTAAAIVAMMSFLILSISVGGWRLNLHRLTPDGVIHRAGDVTPTEHTEQKSQVRVKADLRNSTKNLMPSQNLIGDRVRKLREARNLT